MKQGQTIVLLMLMMIHASGYGSPGQWQSLFNGKNFKGWHLSKGPGVFSVENGEIKGVTREGKGNTFLITDKVYSDFILELEFRFDHEMNSGIQFRSATDTAYREGAVFGYQYELDPSSRGWTGGIYDENRRDWLYTVEYNTPAKQYYKPNTWNKVRIEAVGMEITTFLNGQVVASLVDKQSLQGFIALQVHAIYQPSDAGKSIRWRNLRLLENPTRQQLLPQAELFTLNLVPGFITQREIGQGVELLGANLWHCDCDSLKFQQHWNMTSQEWVVKRVDDVGYCDLISVPTFRAFDLTFEFKVSPGGNSGVKYLLFLSDGRRWGLEYQILDDAKHPDATQGKNGNRTQASLYDLIPSAKIPRGQRAPGQWNMARIVIDREGNLQHWLNGYKVVECQLTGLEMKGLIAGSKYAQVPGFGKFTSGNLLLQDHGDEVAFRNLRIKNLDATQKAEVR